MTSREIRIEAKQLIAQRAQVDVTEAELRISISMFLKNGTAKDFAGKLGVSKQYLSDIRNGRRKLSDEVLGKLAAI